MGMDEVTSAFGNGPDSLTSPGRALAGSAAIPAPQIKAAQGKLTADEQSFMDRLNTEGIDAPTPNASPSPGAPASPGQPLQVPGQDHIGSFIEDAGVGMGANIVGGLAASSLLRMGPLGAALVGIGASGIATYYHYIDKQERAAALLNKKLDPKSVESGAESAGLTDLALNSAGLVAGAVLHGFSKMVSRFVEEAPINRARSMVMLDNELSNAAKSFGSQSLSATGDAITGAIETRRANLGKMYIGKYDTLVEEAAQQTGRKVPLDVPLSKMREVLSPYVEFQGMTPIATKGAKIPRAGMFDDSTAGSLLEGLSPDQIERMRQASGPVGDDLREIVASSTKSPAASIDVMFNGGAPFGSDNGRKALGSILDDYTYFLNAQQKQGGLSVKEYRDFDRLYGSRGKFDSTNPFAGPESAVMRQIDHAMGENRNMFYQDVLGKDTELGKSFTNDWMKYGIQKDSIDQLYKLFGKESITPQLAVEHALNTSNPKNIQNIKTLFGDSNPEIMGQLKGAVIQKALSDNTSEFYGLLNAPGFAKSLNGYSKEVLDEIFTAPERRQLQAFVGRSARLFTEDLQPTTETKGVLLGMISLLLAPFKGQSNGAISRNIYSMFSQNEKAWNYLMETGLPQKLEMAKKTYNPYQIQKIADIMGTLSDYKSLSQTVRVGKRDMIVPLPVLREAFKDAVKQALPEPKNQVPQKTKPDIYNVPEQ